MTVSNSGNKEVYNGNGSTTVFSFPHYFFANGDLQVIKTSTTGVNTTLTITTHYTVSGAGNLSGGSVTMLTAPLTGEKLTIVRVVALTQTSDFVPNDSLPAEVLEQNFDRAIMGIQQVSEKIDRSILLPVNSTLSGLTLPTPDAGKSLKWNVAEDGLENTTASADDAAVSAAAALVSQNAAAASASAASTSESNAATSASTATTQASTATTQAGIATTQAGIATTQAGNAATSATNAENSALSTGARLTSTSTTSNSIGTGTKTWTTQAAKGWAVGMHAIAYRTSDVTQYMTGQVTAYDSGTGSISLNIVAGNTNGSGTYTDWTFAVSGLRGQSGSSSGQALVTVADTTLGYLNSKITVAGSLTKTTLNPGANEILQITGNIKIKQIVRASIAGDNAYSTSSTTFNDTGLSVTITPSSASNLVLIYWSADCNYATNATPGSGALRTMRGASSIEGVAGTKQLNIGTNAVLINTELRIPISRMIVDAPATTSATTYKVQAKTANAAHTLKLGEQSDGYIIAAEFEL